MFRWNHFRNKVTFRNEKQLEYFGEPWRFQEFRQGHRRLLFQICFQGAFKDKILVRELTRDPR